MNTVSQSRRSQPMIRPASHNSFTPVSPKSSTANQSSPRSSTGSAQTPRSPKTPDSRSSRSPRSSRLPKTPIYVINNMSASSEVAGETPQGLLTPYIPAPYELGPNGLQLIVPIRITSHPNINYR